MKKGKKVILAILAILLIAAAFFAGKVLIKPDPQKLAQEILGKMKTVESFNAERTFYIRINGDYEFNGEKYTAQQGTAPVFRIFSRMKVTNDPYHLETEGSLSEEVLLKYGGSSAGRIEDDYQMTSDEKDGLSHLNIGDKQMDFNYTYCPELPVKLFEGIADGSIKVEYGSGDDGWKDDLNFLFLNVNVSGDALKSFFLDEEKQLLGYDLDSVDWDALEMPCKIMIDKEGHDYIKMTISQNNGGSVEDIQSIVDQSFPDWDNKVSVFSSEWYFFL